MKAPPRLIDDPTVAPGLREDLERAGRTGPAYDVAVGLAGFQAVLGAGAGTGASATATSTTTSTASAAVQTAKVAGVLSVKAVVATVVVTAAVATAIAWPSAKPAPARAPREHTVAAAARVAAAPTPAPDLAAVPAAPVAAPPAEALEAAPAPTPAAAPTATPLVEAVAREKRNAARSDDADSRREIAQLARIKALVEVDPARAYRLAQQGDREFARGMLRQERDALAIAALAHSDRTAEAKQRLRAFIARYPNSPAREHLTHLLGTERE